MAMLYPDLSYKVVGAAMAVYNELGSGFLEKVYQEALAIELSERKIPYEREKAIKVYYHGQLLKCPYIADFVIDNKIILELKALSDMDIGLVKSQILNYLKATHLLLGIILNFGADSLFSKRVINFDDYNRLKLTDA